MQKYTYNRATGRLVAKAGMVRPDGSTYRLMEDYKEDEREYQAHLSTLPPDIIVSDEFKEEYKDKPEDWEYEMEKDFTSVRGCSFPNCHCQTNGYGDRSNCLATGIFAYPIVKAEQEDQDEVQRLKENERQISTLNQNLHNQLINLGIAKKNADERIEKALLYIAANSIPGMINRHFFEAVSQILRPNPEECDTTKSNQGTTD